MRFFQGGPKTKSSQILVVTDWICTRTDDSLIDFYKFHFSTAKTVEGWIKYSDQSEEFKAFSASYEKEQNLIRIRKEKEILVAVYSEPKIVAVIDGKTLNFIRSK
jgi:hypothetical protein